MAVKSIIDIDVNDGAFKRFYDLYQKYDEHLKKSPGEWAKVDKTAAKVAGSFEAVVAAIATQTELLLRAGKAQNKSTKDTENAAHSWRDIARYSKDTMGNVVRTTGALLKWPAIFSGLLGAGGLFGLDRMSDAVAATRRTAGGLGIGYGQQKAFGLNFGRFVDPQSLLSGVSNALHDITSRGYVGLLASGMSRNFIGSHNAADVSAELLQRLPQLFRGTPQHLIGSRLKALGLDEVLSQQDVVRYLGASPEERNAQSKRYRDDAGRLNVDPATSRAWQDFMTQMSRAGQGIENTFVKGLIKLEGPLEKFSERLEHLIAKVFANDNVAAGIEKFGTSIEKLADYIGTDDFQDKVRTFVEGIGYLASKIAGFVSYFGGPRPDLDERAARIKKMRDDRASGKATAFGQFTEIFSGSRHNPGNLRRPGQSTGFAAFSSDEDGLRAMARQLRLYQNRDKLDTITGIVSKYAPSSENNTGAYISDVARRTGFGPNQKLDLNDNSTLANLMSAMTKHENNKSNYSQKTVVEVLNNTGGNAVVSTSQVAQ